jgi:hypothetical protein
MPRGSPLCKKTFTLRGELEVLGVGLVELGYHLDWTTLFKGVWGSWLVMADHGYGEYLSTTVQVQEHL